MTATFPAAAGQLRTRGHDRATAAIRTMIAGRTPHAILVSGPAGIGKTTLALDMAAGLLCVDPDATARPCRACRGCRLVERGLHPDLHRLAPSGPGDQIRIGSRERPEDGTVRRLVSDLVLLPVEGGARVAIIERADRLGDDAQTALLKTLEEPPAGVAIVLCADDEDRLMPTIRSRCTRIRLGPVAIREIETILEDLTGADAPLAGRLARIAGGRPGVAWSMARAPEAVTARDEIVRTLLDLLSARAATRLAAGGALSARASDLARALDRALGPGPDAGVLAGGGGRGRGRGAARGPSATPEAIRPSSGGGSANTDAMTRDVENGEGTAGGATDDAEPGDGSGARAAAPAAERRRAASIVVGLWRELTRDLLVARLGSERDVRDVGLLDDLRDVVAGLGFADDDRVAAARRADGGNGTSGAPRAVATDPGDDATAALLAFLHRLDAAGELLEANVRPELILDTLLLAWPHRPSS